jgi:flagellar M-ring protein FliF
VGRGDAVAARGLPAPERTGGPAGEITIDGPDDTPEDPVARLRRLIEARQDETIEILRGWMEEGEERT